MHSFSNDISDNSQPIISPCEAIKPLIYFSAHGANAVNYERALKILSTIDAHIINARTTWFRMDEWSCEYEQTVAACNHFIALPHDDGGIGICTAREMTAFRRRGVIPLAFIAPTFELRPVTLRQSSDFKNPAVHSFVISNALPPGLAGVTVPIVSFRSGSAMPCAAQYEATELDYSDCEGD